MENKQTEYKNGKEYLEMLSNANTSTEQDAQRIQSLMRLLGYPACVVVYGIAYLDGVGTIANPPRSIHSVAKLILELAKRQEISQ